jgi:hypothetical protein
MLLIQSDDSFISIKSLAHSLAYNNNIIATTTFAVSHDAMTKSLNRFISHADSTKLINHKNNFADLTKNMYALYCIQIFSSKYLTKSSDLLKTTCTLYSIEILWVNPSSRTMALWSTQPLTEMSTRNLPEGKGLPTRKADNLITIWDSII